MNGRTSDLGDSYLTGLPTNLGFNGGLFDFGPQSSHTVKVQYIHSHVRVQPWYLFCAVLWIRIRKILGTSFFHLYCTVTFYRTLHKWTLVLWIWIRSDRHLIADLDVINIMLSSKEQKYINGYKEPVKISHEAPFIILRFYVRLPDPSLFVKILIRIKQKK